MFEGMPGVGMMYEINTCKNGQWEMYFAKDAREVKEIIQTLDNYRVFVLPSYAEKTKLFHR